MVPADRSEGEKHIPREGDFAGLHEKRYSSNLLKGNDGTYEIIPEKKIPFTHYSGIFFRNCEIATFLIIDGEIPNSPDFLF